MSLQSRRRDTVVTIDLRDYIDDALDEALDTEDTAYVRDELEAARACLSRPERNPAEALMHIERALNVVKQAIPYSLQWQSDR